MGCDRRGAGLAHGSDRPLTARRFGARLGSMDTPRSPFLSPDQFAAYYALLEDYERADDAIRKALILLENEPIDRQAICAILRAGIDSAPIASE